jgi:lipopolysaccharide/colanic/teichoic acid biosynthesis glycosyltransferase
MENSQPTKALPVHIDKARTSSRKIAQSFGADAARQAPVFEEDLFHSLLTLERRRAERSRQPFVLMLLNAEQQNGSTGRIMSEVLGVLLVTTRETDMIGWYKKSTTLGVIFTEISCDGQSSIAETLRTKVASALRENLSVQLSETVSISVHFFPEKCDGDHSRWMADDKLYSNLRRHVPRKRISLATKRAIDVAGSAALLILMSPILAAIAVLIKLTSKGPVLFAQERLGHLGVRFKCLKFRTMYMNCDPKIHEDFIKQFIAGKEDHAKGLSQPAVYKLTNDPRLTPVGVFLRKTSLDEFPQFWNVLRGEMSLVGPRPPIPYEFESYDIWHRRRVLEVKPGITGLWQVSGRSRTRFAEMVRLDLRYCQSWSLWLDLKILFATPRAVFSGDGAY